MCKLDDLYLPDPIELWWKIYQIFVSWCKGCYWCILWSSFTGPGSTWRARLMNLGVGGIHRTTSLGMNAVTELLAEITTISAEHCKNHLLKHCHQNHSSLCVSSSSNISSDSFLNFDRFQCSQELMNVWMVVHLNH